MYKTVSHISRKNKRRNTNKKSKKQNKSNKKQTKSKKKTLRGGKKKNVKGGYHKKCDYTFYEGKGEVEDRINILKDGQIGDKVVYIANNQLGYCIYEIIGGNEEDGKTLNQIGDIDGLYSDPNHSKYTSDDDSGGKISIKKKIKNKKNKKGGNCEANSCFNDFIADKLPSGKLSEGFLNKKNRHIFTITHKSSDKGVAYLYTCPANTEPPTCAPKNMERFVGKGYKLIPINNNNSITENASYFRNWLGNKENGVCMYKDFGENGGRKIVLSVSIEGGKGTFIIIENAEKKFGNDPGKMEVEKNFGNDPGAIEAEKNFGNDPGTIENRYPRIVNRINKTYEEEVQKSNK